MTAPDDLIRRDTAERAIRARQRDTEDSGIYAGLSVALQELAALPADPVAEAAEAEIVRLRAIEAEAKTYLANMDYCFTAENLTVEDEGHRDASESRLRALLAKGGAA